MSHDTKGQCEVLKQVLSELDGDESITGILNSHHLVNNFDQVYRSAISRYQDRLWEYGLSQEMLLRFQQLHREYQSVSESPQKKFIIVIPVADRPQHLISCLNSLLNLCETFAYGDYNNSYSHITVLIADDSREKNNISENESISKHYRDKGLDIDYFGQKQQVELLQRISKENRLSLKNIIGDYDFHNFAHKGASVMRNIVYLKLHTMELHNDEYLIYFIDSDQEFKVCVSGAGDDVYAINYLYELNNLFESSDIDVLTGKVVGDPPVSPAVMANKFLDDVMTFLLEYESIDVSSKCSFHHKIASAEDASYHDMAEMFGFKSDDNAFRYNCTIEGEHSHKDCLAGFVSRLKGFFYGAHPTRRTWYQYSSAVNSLVGARTVYTGNYIIKPSALNYFIPFAALKLRMAGPVLGRIIKSQIGSRFVSSNLPMLHSRTIDEVNESEFRPGVTPGECNIDLSGEFENQYFGDVMLFSIELLTSKGYPLEELDDRLIMHTLEDVDRQVYENYMQKQSSIIDKTNEINKIIDRNREKFNVGSNERVLDDMLWFFNNIQYNYSRTSKIYSLIDSYEYRQTKLITMRNALVEYLSDINVWDNISSELVMSS